MEVKKLNQSKIKLIAVDIDGVLTDGHVFIDNKGKEQKRIYFRDLDAVFIGREMGLEFMLITGEDNELVDVIAGRFAITTIARGAKDKKSALISACSQYAYESSQVCYIGDSDRDAPAISWAGFGVAPADASNRAMESADYITAAKGGEGVLAEVINLFVKK